MNQILKLIDMIITIQRSPEIKKKISEITNLNQKI